MRKNAPKQSKPAKSLCISVSLIGQNFLTNFSAREALPAGAKCDFKANAKAIRNLATTTCTVT
jgi:hypothetical protein